VSPKAALNFLIKEIEFQDPMGSNDTLVISQMLAKALCASRELEIPYDVLQQDGVAALERNGILGYDVRIGYDLRGCAVDVVVDRPQE
jgi:hypothetical protein